MLLPGRLLIMLETEAGVGWRGSGPETECYLAGSERVL